MENKQLFEKQANSYNPFFPLVRLEDIIETISDKSIQWIFNNYNHIYVEYSESREITRNKVPQILRRSGLWISYNNGKDNITEHYIGENTDVNNYVEWTSDDNWKKFDELTIQDKSITYQHLSDALRQLVVGDNTITNFPDEEDITSDGTVLSFKDRDYDPNTFSGLGRVILRKNLKVVDGQPKNILTQRMIDKENTIYEIRYDFDLNGAEITIPEGCVLDFQGGSLNNGEIVGNNTFIQCGITKIFNNIILGGNYNNHYSFVEWFGAKRNGIADDSKAFSEAIKFGKPIHLCNGTYLANIELNQKLDIIGEDMTKTIIKSFDSNMPTILINSTDYGWNLNLKIENVRLQSAKAGEGIGIKVGEVSANSLFGRYIIERVSFIGYDIAYYKSLGNIYDIVTRCNFENNNSCYVAFDHSDMHQGCSFVNYCNFWKFKYSAIYIKTNYPIYGGQTIISNNVIEDGKGFALLIDGYKDEGFSHLVFEHNWVEHVSSINNVNILNNEYQSNSIFYIKNAFLVELRNSQITSIEVINSSLIIDSCPDMDNLINISKDDNSYIEFKNLNGIKNTKSFVSPNNVTTMLDFGIFKMKHRNNYVNPNYINDIYINRVDDLSKSAKLWYGNNSIDGVIVEDGVQDLLCNELTLPEQSNYALHFEKCNNDYKYHIITVSVKRILGVSPKIEPYTEDSRWWTTIRDIGEGWETYVMFRKGEYKDKYLGLYFNCSEECKLRLQNYQFVSFKKLQDAIEFLNSDYYIKQNTRTYGSTQARPAKPEIGKSYFDTTINKPIWHNGKDWMNYFNYNSSLFKTSYSKNFCKKVATINFNKDALSGIQLIFKFGLYKNYGDCTLIIEQDPTPFKRMFVKTDGEFNNKLKIYIEQIDTNNYNIYVGGPEDSGVDTGYGLISSYDTRVTLINNSSDINVNTITPYKTITVHKKAGSFTDRPLSEYTAISESYFCTDKKTSEGTTNGIILYHKGNDVWVDALGRVVE